MSLKSFIKSILPIEFIYEETPEEKIDNSFKEKIQQLNNQARESKSLAQMMATIVYLCYETALAASVADTTKLNQHFSDKEMTEAIEHIGNWSLEEDRINALGVKLLTVIYESYPSLKDMSQDIFKEVK